MLADPISQGHAWGADVCFLIALVLAAVAAIIFALANRTHERRVTPPDTSTVLRAGWWPPVFGWAALAFIALGFLIL